MHHVALRTPRRRLYAACSLLLLGGSGWLGCQSALTVPPDAALDKLLRPVTTSPNSVKLEIFEARVPIDEDAAADGLWQQVDEQVFDAELRRRLLANGLRAGVVGGTLPNELARLLDLESEMPEQSPEQLVSTLTAVPRVTRRVVHVNRQEPREIQVSEVRPEAQVFVSGDGALHGNTFRQVEGRYELRAEALPGQRVAVRLIPELHHGELRNRYSGSDQGKLMIIPSREREAFEQLTMSAELAAGELLVVGCLPQAQASLGGVLHTVAAKGRSERKIIVVRLLESPQSEILAAK